MAPDGRSGSPAAAADGRGVAVGMFMIFLSGLLFAFMSALTRVASDAGLPALQVVFLSGVVRWVGLGLTLVGEGESPMATPAVRPVLLFRSFCGWASFSGATYAFGRMPLGDATSIFLTSPIWAAILARLLLKEALSAADCLAILLCFGGVLLVIRPGPLSGGDPASPPPPATPSPHANTTPAATGSGSTLLPSLIVLAGAVFAALVAVTVRLIQQRGGAHPAVIAHAYALFTAIVSLPVCYLVPGQVPSWRGIPNEAWAACLGVGILSIPNQLLVNAGLQRTPAGLGAMMRLVDVPAAFALQVFAFGQPPGVLAIVGSVLIVATCAGSAYRKWRVGDTQKRAASLRPELDGNEGQGPDFEWSKGADREEDRRNGAGAEFDRSRRSGVSGHKGWDELSDPTHPHAEPAAWWSASRWWVVPRAFRHAPLLRPAETPGRGVEMGVETPQKGAPVRASREQLPA